ncbi:VOC family protein [Acidimangrovimonas sediminis]|uniref:VOC family protein n=1 Tax=Acidimangrovimonas sediminis TaxID=2056283 RepID=UPI000C808765|nr:VOC family protein [Acidimangrovimonas sediminis]
MLTFDHLAVSAAGLDAGVAAVEAALGVAPGPGGRHARMGTHNRLLGLGDLYLEVIAVDPAAPAPGRARWFDLDRFAGVPRVTNWIARCDDLGAALTLAPEGAGAPVAFERDGLHWQMAVPEDGVLPFDNCFPAMIRWEGEAAGARHPARRLEETGCRLRRLEIAHPRAAELEAALAPLILDARVAVVPGAAPGMRAEIETPRGVCVL